MSNLTSSLAWHCACVEEAEDTLDLESALAHQEYVKTIMQNIEQLMSDVTDEIAEKLANPRAASHSSESSSETSEGFLIFKNAPWHEKES